MQNFLLTLGLILGCALTPTASMAEDYLVPEPYQMVISKGVICNTEQELQTVLTAIALQTDTPVPGCGMLQMPVPFQVTPLGWYETPVTMVLTAKMVAPDGWTQFAWIAYEVKEPTVAPSSL